MEKTKQFPGSRKRWDGMQLDVTNPIDDSSNRIITSSQTIGTITAKTMQDVPRYENQEIQRPPTASGKKMKVKMILKYKGGNRKCK